MMMSTEDDSPIRTFIPPGWQYTPFSSIHPEIRDKLCYKLAIPDSTNCNDWRRLALLLNRPVDQIHALSSNPPPNNITKTAAEEILNCYKGSLEMFMYIMKYRLKREDIYHFLQSSYQSIDLEHMVRHGYPNGFPVQLRSDHTLRDQTAERAYEEDFTEVNGGYRFSRRNRVPDNFESVETEEGEGLLIQDPQITTTSMIANVDSILQPHLSSEDDMSIGQPSPPISMDDVWLRNQQERIQFECFPSNSLQVGAEVEIPSSPGAHSSKHRHTVQLTPPPTSKSPRLNLNVTTPVTHGDIPLGTFQTNNFEDRTRDDVRASECLNCKETGNQSPSSMVFLQKQYPQKNSK